MSRYWDAMKGKSRSGYSPASTIKKGKSWKPLSITPPIILGTMALSLCLAITIEVLARSSQHHDGLAFYSSADEIPTMVVFWYRYMPTVMATLYSLLWNWIDLDIKRLQPWIGLSEPGGALAQTSLLLDYTSDFLPIAPIRAARLRHWPVFISGTTTVLILWILTPLQSSLLGESFITRNISSSIAARSELLPTKQQYPSRRYLYSAYTIAMMDQSYPAFTTPEYALLPFYPDDKTLFPNSTWTAKTTKLWSEVSCLPATSEGDFYAYGSPSPNRIHKIRGEGGCNATAYFISNSKNEPVLVYHGSTPREVPGVVKHNSIDQWSCPKNSSSGDSALIYWAKSAGQGLNITAIQCTVSYHKQLVMATVDSQTLQPNKKATKALSDPEPLSLDEFNAESFLVSVPEDSYTIEATNATDMIDVQNPQLDNVGMPVTASTFFRYGLVGNNYEADTLSDPSQLEDLVKRLYQQFFVLIVSDLQTNQTATNSEEITLTVTSMKIMMSRNFATASETLLLLAFLALGLLFYFTRYSSCVLLNTPSSINALVDIAHNSPQITQLFRHLDTTTEESLTHALESMKFQLISDDLSTNELIVLHDNSKDSRITKGKITKPYYKPVKPWILRTYTGIAILIILSASIVVLSSFKVTERLENGLERPSQSFEVLQLLENYIPTAFATLVEPFWILIARTMCIFQPFTNLWKGGSPAARSIDATYTAIPPQLALFKSIKSRHLRLSLLCLAAVLSNLLAIGLGALFSERIAAVGYPQQFVSQYEPRLNMENIQRSVNETESLNKDFIFVPVFRLKYGAQSSPWTSDEYFFQPVHIPGVNETNPNVRFAVTTAGFRAEANCTSVPASTWQLNKPKRVNMPEGFRCPNAVEETAKRIDEARPEKPVSEPRSIVYIYNGREISDDCSAIFTIGWGKAPDGLKNDHKIDIGFSICQPFIETGLFNIVFDHKGYIIRQEPVDDSGLTVIPSNSKAQTTWLFEMLNSVLEDNSFSYNAWSETYYTQNWLSELLRLDTGSRDIFDPMTVVLDPKKLESPLQRVYRLAFAALMGANTNYLQEAHNETPVDGKRLVNETRIFMDDIPFIITITVLTINSIIALIFYAPGTAYVLPRVPSTIGSILAYIAPSRMVRDGVPSLGWKKETTFSFGRYLGYDGKGYVGIEKDQHVVRRDITLGF